MKTPLIMVALFLLLTACANVTSSALEVHGSSFDRSEINDLLEKVQTEAAADERLANLFPSVDGTISVELSGPVLNLLVQTELLRQAAAAAGLDVSEEDLAAAAGSSEPTGSASVDELLAELNATALVLQNGGVDPNQVVLDAEVTLDPRYGQWSPEQAAVIPNSTPAFERVSS